MLADLGRLFQRELRAALRSTGTRYEYMPSAEYSLCVSMLTQVDRICITQSLQKMRYLFAEPSNILRLKTDRCTERSPFGGNQGIRSKQMEGDRTKGWQACKGIHWLSASFQASWHAKIALD